MDWGLTFDLISVAGLGVFLGWILRSIVEDIRVREERNAASQRESEKRNADWQKHVQAESARQEWIAMKAYMRMRREARGSKEERF